MLSIFSEIQCEILRMIKTNPTGLKQAQIAHNLGIPRSEDNNWITYYVLKSMVNKGILVRNDQKTFILA